MPVETVPINENRREGPPVTSPRVERTSPRKEVGPASHKGKKRGRRLISLMEKVEREGRGNKSSLSNLKSAPVEKRFQGEQLERKKGNFLPIRLKH